MKARLQRFNLFNVKTETKAVPEIISTLRQAGKSSARNDDLAAPKPAASSSSSDCTPSASSAFGAATTFVKRFEVLFCGRVTVAHKKAPPALIDECIEKFSQSVRAGGDPKPESGGGLVDGLRRALALPTLTRNGGTGDGEVRGGGYGASSGGRPVVFKPDPSFPCLRALDENGLSPELHTHPAGVQPTSLQENRTMLFMVGRSQIFLVSPDTKKVAIEKSFREISFCSQGIHHVDHFGFICRETVEGGSCTFVCYVFQCTDESLVDEIMLTLKQAFSVAALQQSVRTRSQQCDSCPMQQLHRLCERIEGLLPSKAKLEFQKHLATLDNQEQAAVFENTVRASPKSDQEENELLMGSLRSLYEQKQRSHQHTDHRPRASPKSDQEENELLMGSLRKTEESSTHRSQTGTRGSSPSRGPVSSRQRLEQFKTRAKRSLTESLEGIWKGSSKARAQRENSEGDISSSDSTLNSTEQDPSLEDPLPSSNPLRSHNSTGDLKRLDTSPLSVSPSFSSLSLSSRDALSQSHGFRRRASTFSHSPSYHDHAPSYPDHTPSYTHTPQVPSSSTKPKLVRHYSVSTDTPHQSKRLQADPTLPFPSFPSPLLSHRPSSPSLGGRLAKRSPLGGLRALVSAPPPLFPTSSNSSLLSTRATPVT
ncbi:TBC1 domain family member 1-like [Oncorhynchus keta]|uniref:TBC1 domain family member 1-like n=1 Tax=Oncorhynchus keta TaxID=8018 RepID=UPI00227CA30D|nr:TBC1 domain family member 1-like [Oncorhynchus keta]